MPLVAHVLLYGNTHTTVYTHVHSYVYDQVCLCIYTQSKKDGFQELTCVTHFELKILYSTLLGKTYSGKNTDIVNSMHFGHRLMDHSCMMQSYGYAVCFHYSSLAHRALPDVEALQELYTQTSLQKLLLSIPIRSTGEQLQHWKAQKECYEHVTKFRHILPTEQARILVKKGLTYKVLCHMCATTKTKEEFKELLKRKGVQRGKAHNKLVTLYPLLKIRSKHSC